jgi:hypothetical protein
MNTIWKIWAFASIGIILAAPSCKKYQVVSATKEVNEVAISLQPNYTAHLGANFQINPVLTFTQDKSADTGRYTYQWYVFSPGLSKVNLDSTRNLTSTVILPPGAYILYYIVKDTVTGVAFQKSANLKVSTPYYEGWMVLSDAGAAPRLDMVSYDDNGVGGLNTDLLGKLGSGLVLSGEAKNVVCTPTQSAYGIYITTTGNGTNLVDPENFSWKSTNNIRYSILDNSIAPDFYADPFVPLTTFTSLTQAIYSNGNIYYCNNSPFALPINRMNGETANFYAAPFMAGQLQFYLYDQTNRRFAYINTINGASGCSPLPAYGTPGASLFDYNNTGMDLVYMGLSYYNGTTVFNILKNPGTGKYYLALINYGDQSQTYYQEMTATDISSATHFAINIDYGYVFYSTGSKLYEYDLGLKTSKLMEDYGASQITDVNSGIFMMSPTQPQQKELLVSTYDPSGTVGSNGTLSIYTVPPVNGKLVMTETYTGFGKIKDIAYRQRQ